jgi:hypothetical protein
VDLGAVEEERGGHRVYGSCPDVQRAFCSGHVAFCDIASPDFPADR